MAAIPPYTPALPPYAPVPNPEYYLSGISKDEQFDVVKSFWGTVKGFRGKWSYVRVIGVMRGEVDEGA